MQSCIHIHRDTHECTHSHIKRENDVLTTPHCLYCQATIQMRSIHTSFTMASHSPKEYPRHKQKESIPVAQARYEYLTPVQTPATRAPTTHFS